ncbi:MAG: CPBP family intramembrane metalloprotease [Gemmatimonadaceae bacterium]|nr:CPBP family intramembrane metalloprotease [Gemmatimonadaceae bacterium]
MFSLGILRLVILLALLGMITSAPPAWQLFLLPAGIGLFLGRYVFQLPQLRWRRIVGSRVSPTLVPEPTRFGDARERVVLLLRRRPSLPHLVLCMAIVAAIVPFALGELAGVCARGEPIQVNFGIASPPTGVEGVSKSLSGFLELFSFVLIEEFVFRGWLMFPLRKLLGAPAAVALTSYLFAFSHLRPSVGVNNLFNGIVFGTAAVLSGSIWTAVSLHFAYNAAVWGWDRFFDGLGAGAISCTLSRPVFLLLAAALFCVLWIGRRRSRNSAAGAG